jgi:hypothetical protein
MEIEMTNVFVVIKKDWDDFEVMGTFTSMEKANDFIGSLETMEERVNCSVFIQEVK